MAPTTILDELDARWNERRAEWARSLGRLRLDAEPLDDQIARHRAACRVMTAVTSAIAVVFLSLFAAFDRPLVGLGLAASFWLPIVALSWRDHARLTRRAQAFEAAYQAYREEREALARS